MYMHGMHSSITHKSHQKDSQFQSACLCMFVHTECMYIYQYIILTVVSVQNDSNGAPAPLLVTVYLMTITLPVAYSSSTMIDETTRSGGGLRVTSMGFCIWN